MEADNPLLQLAQNVEDETSSWNAYQVLCYLELNQETFDALFKINPSRLEGIKVSIYIHPDTQTLLNNHYVKGRSIVGILSWKYTSYFVIEPNLPRGKVVIRKVFYHDTKS